MDIFGTILIVVMAWGICTMFVASILAPSGVRGSIPFLVEAFPDSPTVRRVVGISALVLSPVSVALFIMAMLALFILSLIDGSMYEWIVKQTRKMGM